jgi:hypothetical protein
MTGDHYEGTQVPVPGEVRACRAELLALLEALHAFFSPSGEGEPAVQGVKEYLYYAIAAGTMTAPYRAGMPISPVEERWAAVLTPLVERLLPIVKQLRLDELRVMAPGHSHA